MVQPGIRGVLDEFLEGYKASRQDLLDRDPAFASWLEDQYVPLAGAWQY